MSYKVPRYMEPPEFIEKRNALLRNISNAVYLLQKINEHDPEKFYAISEDVIDSIIERAIMFLQLKSKDLNKSAPFPDEESK